MMIKLCGLRRFEDIEYVNAVKPDFAGFILSDGFKRSVDFGTFYKLNSYLDTDIKRAGVFVSEPIENILHCAYNETLDVIQLHGNEDNEYISELRKIYDGEIWKAVRLRDISDIDRAAATHADKYVLDAFSENAVGGTGKRIDETLLYKAAEKLEKPFFIAGGINEENIAETIKKFSPYGIDISSGTETDGVKDLNKMKAIMNTVRKVEKNV